MSLVLFFGVASYSRLYLYVPGLCVVTPDGGDKDGSGEVFLD